MYNVQHILNFGVVAAVCDHKIGVNVYVHSRLVIMIKQFVIRALMVGTSGCRSWRWEKHIPIVVVVMDPVLCGRREVRVIGFVLWGYFLVGYLRNLFW